MRKITTTFFFLLGSIICLSQKSLPGPGVISTAELELKNCSFEPDAPAMKLFEEEEIKFELYTNGDTRLKTEHRTRIKIFNEKGYKYATIKIPYFTKKSLGKIKELTAYVYTIDATGKISMQKLGKDDFFKENASKDVGTVNFSFPGLKPGCVVEYSYTRLEQNFVDINPWEVQDDIPTGYTSFILITPQTSIVRTKIYGQDSVKLLPIRKKNSMLQYNSYYKENIPSFKAEPLMTSKADNHIKMVFFHFPVSSPLINSITNPLVIWSFIGDYMLESTQFGGQIKKQIPGTDKITDTAKQLGSVREKIKYLYNAVKRHFPGNQEQSYETDDLTEVWKEQSGTSAEINLILLNLLHKLKIKSYPLMVSTRNNGMVDKSFPSFGQLNGIDAIAMIDSSNYYLLDATLENQPIDCPPYNILNREALLLQHGNIQWFMVSDGRSLYKQTSSIICDINSNGLIEGGASIQHYNYAKQYVLDTATDKEDRPEEKFFNTKTQGLVISSAEKALSENEEDPLFETINFTYEPQQTNEFYFYNPSFMLPLPSNPFTSEKRATNIDFGCNQELITALQISLPALFEKDHLPSSISVMTPDSSLIFNRKVSFVAGQISITTNFQIRKAVFDKGEYDSVKDFFRRVQALAAEEIVLIKKK